MGCVQAGRDKSERETHTYTKGRKTKNQHEGIKALQARQIEPVKRHGERRDSDKRGEREKRECETKRETCSYPGQPIQAQARLRCVPLGTRLKVAPTTLESLLAVALAAERPLGRRALASVLILA